MLFCSLQLDRVMRWFRSMGCKQKTYFWAKAFICWCKTSALFSCLNHGSANRERSHEIKPVWNAESSHIWLAVLARHIMDFVGTRNKLVCLTTEMLVLYVSAV